MRSKGACLKHKATKTRSGLDELTFGTSNVRTAVVNGGITINHIDTLLKPYAARRYGTIGLRKTKRDRTSAVVASGYYRVCISGYCSEIKARKRQDGVGLARKMKRLLKMLARTASQSSMSAHVS